jgi:hypothetical protein
MAHAQRCPVAGTCSGSTILQNYMRKRAGSARQHCVYSYQLNSIFDFHKSLAVDMRQPMGGTSSVI